MSVWGNRPAPVKTTACACGDHVFAPLSATMNVLVSPEDADVLTHKWHLIRNGKYLYFKVVRSASDRKTVYLAREILGAAPGEIADHINGDTTDNRRKNLRVCSALQNAHNRRAMRTGSVAAKGVSLRKNGTYQASVMAAGVRTYLGCFSTEEEAAMAYAAAAKRLHGEFARIA